MDDLRADDRREQLRRRRLAGRGAAIDADDRVGLRKKRS
jgi:hypothetical protein